MLMSFKDFIDFIDGNPKISIVENEGKKLWGGNLKDVPKKFFEKQLKSYNPKNEKVTVWRDHSHVAYELIKGIENKKDYPTLREVCKRLGDEPIMIDIWDREHNCSVTIDILSAEEVLNNTNDYDDDDLEWFSILQENLDEQVVKIEKDYMDSYDPYDDGLLRIWTKKA